jgi:hypothetical protein
VPQKNKQKLQYTWRLTNTHLNHLWVIEKTSKEILNFLESKENENTTYHNLWDTAKTVLRQKFIDKRVCIKKSETA